MSSAKLLEIMYRYNAVPGEKYSGEGKKVNKIHHCNLWAGIALIYIVTGYCKWRKLTTIYCCIYFSCAELPTEVRRKDGKALKRSYGGLHGHALSEMFLYKATLKTHQTPTPQPPNQPI
jgi:hypothetical protein